MAVMGNVSRPLVGLLVGTVLFFGLWIVALKPSSSGPSATHGLGQYQPAINAAKASAASQDRAAAAANGASATGSSPSTAGGTSAAAPSPAATTSPAATKAPAAAATHSAAATKSAAHHASRTRAASASNSRTGSAKPAVAARPATPTERLNVVDRALARHKVIALLFYNPAGSDDQAVKRELATIPTSRGRVVSLAVPLSEIGRYPVVTNQVFVQSSPTLVIIDSSARAFTLVGFSARFEIAHRIDDALSAR